MVSNEEAGVTCPICRSTTNAQGRQFSGPMAVSLHIAGKARSINDIHRSWVNELVPTIDFKTATINQIDDQIIFFVKRAINESD